jgi:V/A-type H+-transporting ATPase subunit E
MENLKSQVKFMQEIEANEIIEDATERAKKIIEEAEEKAEKIKNQKIKEVIEELREREEFELELTMAEGKKKISNVKFQLLEGVLSNSIEKLNEISSSFSPLYQKCLEKMIIEAAIKMNELMLEILTNSRDNEFVKEKLAELEQEISKSRGVPVSLKVNEEALNILGGVVVRTADKRKIFNNTLEARLTKAKQEMLDKILVSLFEGAEG